VDELINLEVILWSGGEIRLIMTWKIRSYFVNNSKVDINMSYVTLFFFPLKIYLFYIANEKILFLFHIPFLTSPKSHIKSWKNWDSTSYHHSWTNILWRENIWYYHQYERVYHIVLSVYNTFGEYAKSGPHW